MTTYTLTISIYHNINVTFSHSIYICFLLPSTLLFPLRTNGRQEGKNIYSSRNLLHTCFLYLLFCLPFSFASNFFTCVFLSGCPVKPCICRLHRQEDSLGRLVCTNTWSEKKVTTIERCRRCVFSIHYTCVYSVLTSVWNVYIIKWCK